MSNNPLQKYFRQPKIYINLPSKGIYNTPETFDGSPENIPVYGMTGLDEILLKTPDALISGDATVKIIQSCCPTIKDGWDVSNLDIDLLLVAIRIATYGNTLTMSHTCKNCNTVNEYDVDLGQYIEHFDHCVYKNTIQAGDLTIKLRPLTYKQISDYNIKSFGLQRQLAQGMQSNTDEEQQQLVNQLFSDLSEIQREVLLQGIDSIEIPDSVVNKKEFIKEWLENSEKDVFDMIRAKIDENRASWKLPSNHVTCPECDTPGQFDVDLDQANFFGAA
jgi:hypothetical protein